MEEKEEEEEEEGEGQEHKHGGDGCKRKAVPSIHAATFRVQGQCK